MFQGNTLLVIVSVGVFGTLVQAESCHPSDALWLSDDVTPETCKDACQARPGCTSAIVHRLTHSCYLTMATSATHDICPEFEQFMKTDNTMAPTPESSAANCNVNQVYVGENSDVSCEVKECGTPALIPNGRILGNLRFVGARIAIKCNHTYKLVGPMSMTCNSTGHWEGDNSAGSGQIPQCLRECPPPNNISFATINGSQRLEGSTMTYVCDMRYKINGSGSITCGPDGNWTTVEDQDGSMTTPECVPERCQNPMKIDNGTYDENKTLIGESIEYQCDGQLKPVGPTRFKCDSDGNWKVDANCAVGIKEDMLLTSPPRCIEETLYTEKTSEQYNVSAKHDKADNFTAAAAKCNGRNMHLVSFSSAQEFKFVTQLLEGKNDEFYVGLNDRDKACQWKWIDSPDEAIYFLWEEGEPNIRNYKQHCVLIEKQSGVWRMRDTNCNRKIRFVCESEP